MCSLILAFSAPCVLRADADELSEEATAVRTYEQFLIVLLRNPRFGTAWDRVYEFHANRGTIQDFRDALAVSSGLKISSQGEDRPSGSSPKEAISPFKDSPDPGAAVLLVGMLDLQHVEGVAAIAALEFAAQLRPGDAIAHWYLGKARTMNRQFGLAAESFERAIKCGPAKTDLLEIYKELARAMQRSQQDSKALEVWQRLENLFPGDLRVKEQIATALAQDGRWQDALTRYEAMATESTHAEQRVQANLSAADLMIQLARPQDAIDLLESQLDTLDSDSWLFKEVRRRIEATFRGRNELPALVAYYEARVAGYPDDIDAMTRLGRTLSLQNRPTEAAAWYHKAIELAPSNVALRESLIEQLVREGHIVDAIEQYEQMGPFHPGNRDHIEQWGQLYLSRKDLPLQERRSKAAEVWEQIIINGPKDPVALSRLAELLRRTELTDRVLDLYHQAIELAPNEPQYREYLGEYLHQLQRPEEALAAWKEIAAGDRRTKATLFRVSEVLQGFGYLKPALNFMREACKLDPEPGERLKFAELLRSDGPQHSIEQALEQLDLADQSAPTSDERQQILTERIKTLIVAGQLAEQTNCLAAELNAGNDATAERWRTLALYQDAGDQLNEAATSAAKVVELEPQSISGWSILADLSERTGRLGDAVTATRRLVSLDRRGVSAYLRKIARYEIRLGQFDGALQTGRDVIKATPGDPEAYQFFADLAFEAGQPQAALDALRQAVRINPGDTSSLRALAKTLADEFQTPEAIELYWRAFEKAADLETQTNIVVALSNLYLRSNRFEELVERLDLRSRELNLPTEMTRCIAIAWREAGDFRKSRETLERLTTEESQNVSLLQELRQLAEQEHNLSQMEQYQRQIAELTDSTDERRLLIEILSKEHRYDEAAKERLRLAESRTDRKDILNEIEILVSGGYDDVAELLCQRLLESSKTDWEALNAYRGILLRRQRLVEAREVSRTIIQLKIDFDEPSTTSELRQDFASRSSLVTNSAEAFSDWLVQTTEDSGMNFGAVYCDSAKSLIFRVGASASQTDIETVFASHLPERDKLRLAGSVLCSVTPRSPLSQKEWMALESFLQGQSTPARIAIQLFATSQRFAADDLPAEGQQELKLRSLKLLKQLIEEAPEWLVQSGISNSGWIPAGEENDAFATTVEQQLTVVARISDLRALWYVASGIERPATVKRILESLQKRLLESPAFALNLRAAISGNTPELDGTDPIAIRLRHDADGLLLLLNLVETLGAFAERPAQPAVAAGFRGLPEILNDHFGETSGGKLSRQLQLLLEIHAENRVEHWLRTKLTTVSSVPQRVGLHLIRAELARQLGDETAEISSLIDAAEATPQNYDVRFMVADFAARQSLVSEAVLLLDSMNLPDAARQIVRESFVVRYLLPFDHSDRCVLAANRLFGLPLNLDQQRELILLLERLGMPDKVAAVQARLGRGTEDRESFLGRQLQINAAKGNDALAAEIAWELLKLASGGSLFSGHRPGDDRDDGGERLQAIKALGILNRLQPLIDRYETMLSASPNSVELLEILAEFHESAEQWDLLAAKRDRIALLSKKAPPTLRVKATELERSGDVSGACDIYLRILKDTPEAFSDEIETYVQAFERAQRHADFLTGVLAADKKYWTSHAGLLINVVTGLNDAHTNPDVVQNAIQTLLRHETTRRLALGGFLARGFPEEQFIPALQNELSSLNAMTDFSRCNEMFQILHTIKHETTLSTVLEFLKQRASLPQRAGANSATGSEEASATGTVVLLVYLEARLGQHEEVEIRVERLLNPILDSTEDSDIIRTPVFQFLPLNTRLKELGPQWNDVRRLLLEYVTTKDSDSRELDDSALDELGEVYLSLGRSKDATHVLNSRIQRLMRATGSAGGETSNSIRQLLQAGESIQHSGFPIEGARLLLNVTEHDIAEFTSDLDDDKAVAFKSRFHASQRWARQQISAEKLVTWFTSAVEALADSDSDSGTDLLLELSGTTDPRARDVSQLQTIRINSAILTAIDKQAFDDEQQQKLLKASIQALLIKQNQPESLLTAALALSVRMNDADLNASVVRALDSDHENEIPESTGEGSTETPIPQALRTAVDVPRILAAKILLSSNESPDVIQRLIAATVASSRTIKNRLVRIAILNDCLATAIRARLDDLSNALKAERDVIINDQISAVSIGTPSAIDFRREIRQRLLGLD